MNYIRRFLFISVSLLASFGWAQSKCEYALLGDDPSSKYETTKKYIGNEFDLLLNDNNMAMIDKVINRGEPITEKNKETFKKLLSDLKIVDAAQKKEAEAFLKRSLSDEEAIALKLARGLGRTEAGKDELKLAFSGNYTEEQIDRKDRILELAGFSFEERVALVGNKFVDDILTKYTAENLLWDNATETPEQAVAMNKEVITQMDEVASKNTATQGKLNSLDEKQATALYEAVTRHPVARILKLRKYDPESKMGFCFGRAMTSHLEALQSNVDRESIRKVFVVGAMKAIVGDIIWQFHVATAVKRTDGGWWVIDPFFGKVVTLEKWYEKMYKQDTKGTLRLYVTEAPRMGATGSQRYQRAHLMMDYYNGYFKDLIKHYRMKAHDELPAKSVWIKMFDWLLSVLHIGI